MADMNCQACEELRQEVPQLLCNGFDESMCASLKNDTGLSPTSGNNDCTDLDNLNDCLVGNMAKEVDTYEVCDWKSYMKKFIPNLWTTLKAMICAICGIWTNIHNIMRLLTKLQCEVDYLFQGDDFKFSEYTQTSTSYLVAGKGVSFANVSASGVSGDVTLTYIAGGLGRLDGSCKFYNADFHESVNVMNFDDNDTEAHMSTSGSRKGASIWHSTNQKPQGGSALVYEIRLLKSEYPQIRSFFEGIALNSQGGGYHCEINRFTEGTYAYGQWGYCDRHTGDPANSDSSRGHRVADGYVYLQMRITWIETMSADADGSQYTPNGFLGIRMKQSAIEC